MENASPFKSSVPAPLRAKIKTVAMAILGDWDSMVNKSECIISPEDIGEIEGNYVSGWIPHQDGGYTVSGYYRCDQDSSHFTEKQTEFVNDQAEQCFAAFLSDNGFDSETEWSDLTEEQQEKLCEYEHEWFEESLLQYEIFCNGFTDWKKEEKTVTVRVSVNYKDAPYYREKYAEDIKSTVYFVDEFMSLPIAEILEAFKI